MSDLKRYIQGKIGKEEAVENFKKWFGDSKIKDQGVPIMLYHGTLSNFSTFDIEKSHAENFFGPGFYFSDAFEEVNENYTSQDDSDMSSKISSIEEYFENEDRSDIEERFNLESGFLDDDDIFFKFVEEKKAERLSFDHEGLVMPVYVKMEKPMIIEEEVFFQSLSYGKDIDNLLKKIDNHDVYCSMSYLIKEHIEMMAEDICYYLEVDEVLSLIDENYSDHGLDSQQKNNLNKMIKNHFKKFGDVIECQKTLSGEVGLFVEAVEKVLDNHYEYVDSGSLDILKRYLEENYSTVEYEEIAVKELVFNDEIANEWADVPVPLYDQYGMKKIELSWRDVCSLAFQEMGYDGIVMNVKESMPYYFPKGDYYEETGRTYESVNHYIVFDAKNIKSAIGNNGEYSIDNPDIMMRINNNFKIKNQVTKDDAFELIEQIRAHYPNLPKINLYESPEDVPASYEQKYGSTYGVSGNFEAKDNRANLFLFNMTDRSELQKTVFHEIFGHMSMRQILKENYTPVMSKIYDYYEQRGELEKIKDRYVARNNLDLSKKSHRAYIAEEKMAFEIENRGFTNFPLKSLVIGAVRSQIRKIMPDLTYNKDDIEFFIHRCYKNMQKKDENKLEKKQRLKM